MLSCTNLDTIMQIKEQFVKELANSNGDEFSDLAASKLRFFGLGKELEDSLSPYNYNIDDDMTIQAIIKPNK